MRHLNIHYMLYIILNICYIIYTLNYMYVFIIGADTF